MPDSFQLVSGWEQHVSTEELLTIVTDHIADDARDRVPVRTGNLRESIYSKVENGVGTVGASAEYAADVELGTSHMAAEPFLRPALFQERTL